jgi:cell division protein FtsN
MKWVALTLLLLNGVFLVVQLNKEQAPPATVERHPISGQRLMLVSEQQQLEKAKAFAEKNRREQLAKAKAKAQTPPPSSGTKASTSAVEAPASRSSARACYRVGPLLLIGDLRSVASQFRSKDITVRERSEVIRKQAGYWVYIPPLETQEQARDTLYRIKEHDLKDALIISEGSKANAISIGVYKTKEQGEEQRSSLDKLGFKARVEPLYRTQAQYWLDLELLHSTQIPAGVWAKVSAGYPNVEQLRRKCE